MLSQAVGHAATSLACISAIGAPSLLVKEISENCDIPGAYLAKIINALAHKGIVLTQRGVGGGVSLARPATEITLYELCTALDDPVVKPRCMLGNAECTEDRACPAHQFCSNYREDMRSFLKQTTIADIAAFETRRRWRLNQAPGNQAPANEA